jgi:hypothetical protein
MSDHDDITVETDGDGMDVHVDLDSELGKKLAWHAGHRGEDPEEFLKEAVREQLEDDEVSR